jgi:hypothetical protein
MILYSSMQLWFQREEKYDACIFFLNICYKTQMKYLLVLHEQTVQYTFWIQF